jgi:hypothetical protein
MKSGEQGFVQSSYARHLNELQEVVEELYLPKTAATEEVIRSQFDHTTMTGLGRYDLESEIHNSRSGLKHEESIDAMGCTHLILE